MKFVAIILVAALVATGCGGSFPSGPSAVATPTPSVPFQVNVELATKALVRFTCSGTASGVPWKFEAWYSGPNLYYRAPTQDPMVLENGKCGSGGFYPAPGMTDVTSVTFKATNPSYPKYELTVELK